MSSTPLTDAAVCRDYGTPRRPDVATLARRFEETLRELAAQWSGVPGSTSRADCMAALAGSVLRSFE